MSPTQMGRCQLEATDAGNERQSQKTGRGGCGGWPEKKREGLVAAALRTSARRKSSRL